jgi:hypothetical protein
MLQMESQEDQVQWQAKGWDVKFPIIISLLSRSVAHNFGSGRRYAQANAYNFPLLSSCQSSKPNASSLREWWELELSEKERKEWYFQILGEPGDHKVNPIMEPWLSRRLLALSLQSPSLIAWMSLRDIYSLHHTEEERLFSVSNLLREDTKLLEDFSRMVSSSAR